MPFSTMAGRPRASRPSSQTKHMSGHTRSHWAQSVHFSRINSGKKPCREADKSLLMLRSEEHTSELQSRENLVCRLLLEKKNYPTRLAQHDFNAISGAP